MNTLRRLLIAVSVILGLSTVSRADDIDIYTDTAASSGVPNVLFVIDNGANFEASGGSTACAAYNSGGAPSLGSSNGGIQQCALVNAIEALPDGAVNIGILVGNANNFAKGYSGMSTSHAAYYNTCDQSTGYGGCVIRPLALMNSSNKTNLVNFIKSWTTSGQDSATAFNVKAGGNKTANMMQEAWAYFNGKVGMSGRNYATSISGSGCQKNFIIFIANAAGSSSTPADTPNGADAQAALAELQVGATAAQKTKISEIAKFATTTCGVSQLAPGNQASNWSSSWMDEWARLMYQQDGNSTGQGRQSISTYSIGLIGTNCQPDYPALLTTAAKYGGGRYFSASSSVELTDAINTALNEIQAVNSVFSSASLPVSVNAQGTYLNQVFLGMFRPDASGNPRWLGNLKQYQFVLVGANPLTAELRLGDSNGNTAISSAGTGFITPGAVSFWTTDSATTRDPALSTAAPSGFFVNDVTAPTGRNGYDSPDGELVERGGAAERLRIENLTATFSGAATAVGTTTNPRRLYTYCSADSVCAAASPSNDLTAAVNQFTTTNTNLPALAFGDSTTIRITQITRSGSTATATTVGNHGFASGSTVTISNASEASYNGSKTLTSASGNTFTFAAADYPTTPSQGVYVFSTVAGSSVAVTQMARLASISSGSASASDTVIVTTAGHSFAAGTQVTISGATPSVYNGNWSIALPNSGACPSSTCFTYSVPLAPNATASGFSAVVAPSSVAIGTITSTGNSGSGGTGNVATVTTTAAHGFHQGQFITIANSGNSKYNATNVQVVSVTSSTRFTYQGYANGAPASASGGSATPSTTAVAISLARASNATSTTATATGATANAFGRVSGDTKVLNITKAGATAGETGYAGSNITVTCQNSGCTSFSYAISTSPAQPTGTITAAPVSGGASTIVAGNITRSGSTATVTGATGFRFGAAVNDTNTINVTASGTIYGNESAYVGSGTVNITCLTVGCTSFSYPVVQTPALSVTDSNMQAFQAGTAPAKDPLITWVRGQDNFGDELGPGGSVTVRPSIHGDVLHSRPVVINYGDSRGIVAFYGANDGVYRAVNGNKTTGNIGGIPPGGELWGLILPEHLGQLNRLRLNSPELKLPTTRLSTAEPKDYFVDGSTGVYQKLNADGTISQAILYLTMRRGGRFIYAIDVSTPTSPQVLWKRSYTDTGFEEMGQSWSRPRVTLVKGYTGVGGTAKPVLVFGGGYDPAEDAEPPSTGTMGRGIFVVDALTGALVWSAKYSATTDECTGTSTQASCSVRDMKWAIPSDITFVDRDNNGLTDRFYVGDVGGNVWRVDLESESSGTVDTWKIRRLAALGCTGGSCSSGTNPRKFFYPPSVVSVGVTGASGSYDLVGIGSGDREHPLQSSASYGVTNRFYAIKDADTSKAFEDRSPIVEGDMFNGGTVSSVNTYDGTRKGFYVTFATGEKAVNAPVTTRGVTFFGTNRPTSSVSTTCSANLGEAKGYALNPFTGALSATTFAGGGLPPSPTVGIVNLSYTNADGSTQNLQRQFCVGCGAVGTANTSNSGDATSALGGGDLSITVPKNPRRTYWYER